MSEVNLVGITQPAAWTGCETAAELVAYAARVSNPANQSNKLTSPKLLKYLIKHKHWSPFEMVSMTMEIKTTRDIGRQILRHRSFSFQEFSQRYAKATEYVQRDVRLQDNANRQNSINPDDVLEPLDALTLELEWSDKQIDVLDKAVEVYSWALDQGIAKEQARVVLPEGNTQTTMYMSGTLRSWIHYCELRTGPETQKEHRIVAKQCWKVVKRCFPEFEGMLE